MVKTLSLTAALLLATATAAAAGDDAELLAPFTALTAKSDPSGVEVGAWGRTHKFHGVLPASIVTQGEDILAAPIRLVGRASGEPIEWSAAVGQSLEAMRGSGYVTRTSITPAGKRALAEAEGRE